jgi:F-type H+-transporting ATPase subunit delta
MSEQGDSQLQQTTDVGAQRVARVYAEALLNAAQKRGEVDAILEQFESLVRDALQTDSLVGAFFSSPAVPAGVKAEVIKKVCAGRASELFTNFLLVVNDHGRLELLRTILFEMRELNDKRARRLRVLVRSAVPLPDDQRETIRQGIQNHFQLEPILDLQVDPALLGGVVVKVGDWVYDGSVRERLQTFRNHLLARSSHEIQSRRNRFGD